MALPPMKKLAFLLLFFTFAQASFAQSGEVTGIVKDKSTGETIPGVTVSYADGKGTATDINGQFLLKLDNGEYTLTFAYLNYITQEKKVTVNDKKVFVNILLESQVLDEVEVVADIAVERQTPVAFINVNEAKLQEQVASQDIPMVLNTTPGVYATQQGGGDGDARITIRGFNQRNVAVMIDGVPMNDMENGWVYWSNWFGLDNATRTIQVQRGLGASKLASPAVGGSINIITKGIDEKRGASIKQEVGSDAMLRTTLTLTSGKMKNGFGVTAAGSYKSSDGYVDNTWSKMWFYFLKVEKVWGKHTLSVSAMGAPQQHGQRSYKKSIATYSKKYAQEMFEGSDEAYEVYRQLNRKLIDSTTFYSKLEGMGIGREKAEELEQNFVDTTGVIERGLRFNENWGYIYRTKDGDSANAKREVVTEKLNYFHKPIFNLRHFWSVNDKLYISNIAYASYGEGGGTGLGPSSTAVPFDKATGQYDFALAYNTNAYNRGNLYKGEQRSSSFIRSSVNNHEWYGLLSTATYKLSSKVDISGGIDARTYRGIHYQMIYDLLGGDLYFADKANKNQATREKRLGDKVNFHNDGFVRWGGAFAMAEYKGTKWSGFISTSGSYSGYNRIDYFRKKDIVLSDTTLKEAVGFADTITYNGMQYHNSSPEAKFTETGWKYIPGFTIKGGANYNLTERMNVFFNLGYLSRTPRFNNVIDRNNSFINDVQNELVKAAEVGYMFRSKKVAATLNTYYTYWENKPVETPFRYPVPGAPDEFYTVNINGMSARHMGAEVDFAWNALKQLTVEGMVSMGDWVWDSPDTVYIFDESNAFVGKEYINATGVHVGDAAQNTYTLMLRYEPVKNLYIRPQYTYFAKNYSNFDPFSLTDANEGRESWRMPDYALLDIHAGYRYELDKVRFDLRGSVLNAMNTMYIADAENNDSFASSRRNFDAGSASVFFGLGRRYVTSLTITF